MAPNFKSAYAIFQRIHLSNVAIPQRTVDNKQTKLKIIRDIKKLFKTDQPIDRLEN